MPQLRYPRYTMESSTSTTPHAPTTMPTGTGRQVTRAQLLRVLMAAVVAAILGAVFSLYAHPDFMLDVANQLWSCF